MKRITLALKNTLSQTLARLYSSALGFFTAIIVINSLGTSLYGDLSKVTALLAIGYTALDFGLNAHAVRMLSKLDSKGKSSLISNLIYFRLILSGLISIALILALLVLATKNPAEYSIGIQLSLLIGLISIFSQSLHISTNALFQHQEKYERMTISVIAGATLAFIATIAAINLYPGIIGLTLALTIGYVSTALISLYLAKNYISRNFSYEKIKEIVRGSLALALTLLLSTIANRSDILIQSLFQSSSQVGEYAFAYKIFDFALILPVFLMNSLYPSILKNITDTTKTRADLKKMLKGLLLLSLGAFLALTLASPLVILFKPELALVSPIIRTLSLSLPFFYISAPLMWILVALKREKLLIPVYGLAAVINIVGNYLLSPTLGIISAAYMTFGTELIIALALFRINKKLNYV